MLRESLIPKEYRKRIERFNISKKNGESYYVFNDVKYKITEKQSTYSLLYKGSVYIAGVIAGVFGRLTLINELISIFVRALIGALFGALVAVVSLRLFIKESDRNSFND